MILTDCFFSSRCTQIKFEFFIMTDLKNDRRIKSCFYTRLRTVPEYFFVLKMFPPHPPKITITASCDLRFWGLNFWGAGILRTSAGAYSYERYSTLRADQICTSKTEKELTRTCFCGNQTFYPSSWSSGWPVKIHIPLMNQTTRTTRQEFEVRGNNLFQCFFSADFPGVVIGKIHREKKGTTSSRSYERTWTEQSVTNII